MTKTACPIPCPSEQVNALLLRACQASERLAEIPLAPTPSWCNHACAVLSAMVGGGRVLGVLGSVDASARVAEIELTGLAGVRDEHTTATREQLAGIRSLGLRVPTAAPYIVVCDASSSLASPGSLAGLAAATERQDHAGVLAVWWVGQRHLALMVHDEQVGARGLTSLLWALMPGIARRAAAALGATKVRRRHLLTPIEERVMHLLARGLSVPEIAAHLHRSRHTIHDHVKSLHRKMGVETRVELVSRAMGRAPGLLAATAEPMPEHHGAPEGAPVDSSSPALEAPEGDAKVDPLSGAA